MLLHYALVFGIALLPFVELRLAIPIGIGMGLSPLLVFLTAVTADILLGFLLIELLSWIDSWLPHWKFLKIGHIYGRVKEKSHRKLHRFTEKYGVLGVALFIAVPLPGSGVYTGTLGAFLIGLDKRRYRIACVSGVLIAGVIVTFLSVGAFSFF
jgi:uncharacterized membrane protein